MARQEASFDVLTSTPQLPAAAEVCHKSTRLSGEESCGEFPSCRYGFSRNGLSGAPAWPSRNATGASNARGRSAFNIWLIVSHFRLVSLLRGRTPFLP